VPIEIPHDLERANPDGRTALGEALVAALGAERSEPEGWRRLKAGVYRLATRGGGSVVVKRLAPARALRTRLVAGRWLPAAGLEAHGPALLGEAAERHSPHVWQVYADLGDGDLRAPSAIRRAVDLAVAAIARLHRSFRQHALLAEVRLHGGELGGGFLRASCVGALRALKAAGPPRLSLTTEQFDLRDRLISRLERLQFEVDRRSLALDRDGGDETLLHGDLWPANILVTPGTNGSTGVRFIDWDHAAVGPPAYDLSTLLLRFPPAERGRILDRYRECCPDDAWLRADRSALNQLFESAEVARCANRLIWPALAAVHDHYGEAFTELAEIERWFLALEPVLPADPVRTRASLDGSRA